jgi:diguanylate cyclase (GGDEF)-like protein
LVENGPERERMLDMDRRLRPVRLRTFLILTVALLFAAPWAGWWTLGPLVLAGIVFRAVEGKVDQAFRPEYWMFGAWAAAEVIIAASILLTGESAISMLALLAVPVVTLSARFSSKGIWVGVALAIALILLVAVAADSHAVVDDPPLVIAPIAVVVAASMLSTALMHSDVEHRDKAVLDPLTGLLNRSSLEARAMELEHQSTMTRAPVGVVLLDLDNFKRVNDSYGHAAGDGVLVDVAYRLRKGLRSYDLIYRIGGDEILILVPGADLEHVQSVGQKARLIVQQVQAGLDGQSVTASCGVSASQAGEPFDFAAVSACADRALYAAKKSDGLVARESGRIERFGAADRVKVGSG